MAKMWEPADLVAVAVFSVQSGRPREIVYRKTYRWRWIPTFMSWDRRWDYKDGILLFWRVCDTGKDRLYG